MKIAIGFFGITRSLKYTIKSIEENIFNILISNNIEYDIYVHTYFLSSYKNIRTKEEIKNLSEINNEEYKLLKPTYYKQDIQKEIKKKINLSLYYTQKDPWNTGYDSVNNFILGSYSKKEVTNMIEKNSKEYDYIFFMRPDCMYTQPLNIEYLKLVTDNSIVIPNFHLFGIYKINDRFAITNKKTYKKYGEVFDRLLEFSKKQPLHSETLIGYILIEIHKIKCHKVLFNFSRVRCNGFIQDTF